MGKLKSKHLFLLLTIAIPALVTLFIYRDFLTGSNLYLYAVVDGYSQYLPTYMNYVHIFSNFDGFTWWNYSSGLGTFQNYDVLLYPFNLFPMLFGVVFGELGLHVGFAWMQVLKIVLAGLFMYLFLRKIKIADAAAFIGAISYALCGLIVLRGFWGFPADECFIAILLLFCTECYFQDNKWWLIPPCVFLIGVCLGFYFLFLYAVLLCIYTTARFVYSGTSWREFPLFMLKNIGIYLLGVLAWGVILIGFTWSLFGTERFSATEGYVDDNSPFKLVSPSILLSALMSLFDPNFAGVFRDYSGTLNYLERPLFYCGLLSLFLIPQAFILGKKRAKGIFAFFFCLALLYMIVPFCTDIFNAFIHNEELGTRSYRLSSLWIQILLVVVAAYGLHCAIESRRFSVKGLIVAGVILCFAFLFICFEAPQFKVKIDHSVACWIAVFLAAWIALLPFCVLDREKRKAFCLSVLLVSFLLVFELAHSANTTVNGAERDARSAVEEMQKDSLGYYGSVNEALDFLEEYDKGLYRISGIRPTAGVTRFCSPLYFGINDTSYYSNIDGATYRYLSELCPDSFTTGLGSKYSEGVGGDVVLSTLVGYKYHFAKHSDEELDLWGYELIKTIGDIDIYENQYALSFGTLHNQVISEGQLQDYEAGVQCLLLYEYVALKDPMLSEDMKLEKTDVEEQAEAYEQGKDSEEYKKLYFDKANQLRGHQLNVVSWDRNIIQGKVHEDTPSILVFSAPLLKGWHAKIDGADAELQQVDYGLIGLHVESGDHDIELYYQPDNLIYGVVVSLGAICAYVLLIVKPKKRKHKKALKLEI